MALGASLLVAIGLLGGCESPRTTPRHVVLISIDTLRRDHLPCYGSSEETAPFIGELAADSVVFDNAIAASSVTVPSHASMLTGLAPPRHGALNNKCRVRENVALLAEVLSQRGFHTAAFVGGAPLRAGMSGLERGFDVYDDDFGAGNQRTAAETVGRFGNWLTSNEADRPTFLFVHFFDPHYPYEPPAGFAESTSAAGTDLSPSPPYPEFTSMRDRGFSVDETARFEALYDGEIRFVDHQIRTLLMQLESSGFLDNSLLILVADHGETLAEREWVFDHGCRLYDEQIRVPLMIRFPDRRHGGRRVAEEVHHIDLAPTILDWLGLDPPHPVEGISLLKACADPGTTLDGRVLFSMARRDLRRVSIEGDHEGGIAFIASARTGHEKVIAYPVAGGFAFELFDLERDPAEVVNLAATRADERARLWAELVRWLGGRPEMLRETPETFLPKLKATERNALEELGYLEPRDSVKGDPSGR